MVDTSQSSRRAQSSFIDRKIIPWLVIERYNQQSPRSQRPGSVFRRIAGISFDPKARVNPSAIVGYGQRLRDAESNPCRPPALRIRFPTPI